MPLVVQTNVASLQAQKNLSGTQSALGVSFNRLSSGYRINSAKDDAAGLAISESMKSQIRSYAVAERNANDAVSMAQTAEGALGEVTSLLGRMRELAMQGSNGSLGQTDRTYLQTEFGQLQNEMVRIQSGTSFNGRTLIASGTTSTQVAFQVGINNVTGNDVISVSFGGLDISQVATSGVAQVSGTTGTHAQDTLDRIDATLTIVSTMRANYGAIMNRLDTTVSNIQTARLNISAANSRIRDVDVAEETAQLSRQQVLAQAGSAVLAQANSSPQMALGLLR